MNITTYSSHGNIKENTLKDKTVICIDTFCSTTMLISAFSNGMKRVLIVDDPTDVPTYRQQISDKNILMGGAYNFERITGMDVSDSFLDYDTKKIKGKELIYSNLDLSPTIKKSLNAKQLYLGGFVNASAVAKTLVATASKDVVLVCCGSETHFALEDGLAAGCIIKELSNICDINLSEYSFVMDCLYRQYADHLLDIIDKSASYQKLVSLNLLKDIDLAIQINKFDLVPIFDDNWITIL